MLVSWGITPALGRISTLLRLAALSHIPRKFGEIWVTVFQLRYENIMTKIITKSSFTLLVLC